MRDSTLKKISKLIVLTALVCSLNGCAFLFGDKQEKKESVNISFVSHSLVNPDSNSRSSPVAIYIYNINDIEEFSVVDYFTLVEDSQTQDKSDFYQVDNFVISPSESRKKEYVLEKDQGAIGIVAAFRDLENSQWKLIVDRKEIKRGLFKSVLNRNSTINLNIDKNSIIYQVD